MKTTLLPKITFGLIVVTLLFVQCTSNSEKLHQKLQQEVAVINKQCPQMINSTIRIDSCVLLKNNDTQYYYTYTDTLVFDTLRFEDEVVASAKELTRTDLGMTEFRNNGLTNEYIYRDLKGNTLYRFKITPADYQ